MRLQVATDPEHSVSFAVGSSLRKAVLKPWLFPLLPITMAHSIRHRKTIEVEPYLPEHEMIIIDMEMIRRTESEVMMEVIAAQHPSALVMCIGPSHTNQGTIPLLPRPRAGQTAGWSSYIKKEILHMVRTRGPRALLYVGKYPHSGIRQAISSIAPTASTAWLAMRADDDVFRQHAPMFGHASMFDGESGPDLLTYHIYKGLEQDVLNPAFSVGVEEADVVLMPTEEAGDVQQLLQKGQAVVVVGEGFRADLRGLQPCHMHNFLHVSSLEGENEVILTRMIERLRAQTDRRSSYRVLSRLLTDLSFQVHGE